MIKGYETNIVTLYIHVEIRIFLFNLLLIS